ncbi:hypothetical protein [Nocardia amikacinitolerans]|uniref:hypothetical protein n=1 Tax=Nocardia amikacinitolerans TaxID=756689 RepID=UPI0020A53E74|nr:hypothetical protein [Nocardia amikacinitolerans]MCP2292852.1 hypothetical protein [Nocardia amikacinitolerans]
MTGTDPTYISSMEHFESMPHEEIYAKTQQIDAGEILRASVTWLEVAAALAASMPLSRGGADRVMNGMEWEGAAANAAYASTRSFAASVDELSAVMGQVGARLGGVAAAAEAVKLAVVPPGSSGPIGAIAQLLEAANVIDAQMAQEALRQEAVLAMNMVYKPAYSMAGNGVPALPEPPVLSILSDEGAIPQSPNGSKEYGTESAPGGPNGSTYAPPESRAPEDVPPGADSQPEPPADATPEPSPPESHAPTAPTPDATPDVPPPPDAPPSEETPPPTQETPAPPTSDAPPPTQENPTPPPAQDAPPTQDVPPPTQDTPAPTQESPVPPPTQETPAPPPTQDAPVPPPTQEAPAPPPTQESPVPPPTQEVPAPPPTQEMPAPPPTQEAPPPSPEPVPPPGEPLPDPGGQPGVTGPIPEGANQGSSHTDQPGVVPQSGTTS